MIFIFAHSCRYRIRTVRTVVKTYAIHNLAFGAINIQFSRCIQRISERLFCRCAVILCYSFANVNPMQNPHSYFPKIKIVQYLQVQIVKNASFFCIAFFLHFFLHHKFFSSFSYLVLCIFMNFTF